MNSQELHDHIITSEYKGLLSIVCQAGFDQQALIMPTINALKCTYGRNILCLNLDFSLLCNNEYSEHDWFKLLIQNINKQLKLLKDKDLDAWIKKESKCSNISLFSYFIEDIVLGATKSEDVVIFITNIEKVSTLSFSIKGFFRAIRGLFLKGAIEELPTMTPKFKRLNFVFVGTKAPVNLMNPDDSTPFNVGEVKIIEGGA